MLLSEKGRFAPPPTLKGAAQRVSETIASWKDVHARAHWLLGDEDTIDGADFYLGQEEIGHIHLYSEAHVMLPRAVADALIKAKLASTFPSGRDVVAFAIKSKSDIDHALWLFELSYSKHRGMSDKQLLQQVAERARDSKRETESRA